MKTDQRDRHRQAGGAEKQDAAGLDRRRPTYNSQAKSTGQAANWPGMDALLDGVLAGRSVSLFAMRRWLDAEVDLGIARADRHGWNADEAMVNAVERLRETLHTAVDMAADQKLAIGADGRLR